MSSSTTSSATRRSRTRSGAVCLRTRPASAREPTLGCPSCQDVDRRIGGTMDLEDIRRLRVQGFTVTRRGYDRREVDRFLDVLLDWIETDAAKDLGDHAVARKLELVGKSTAQILLTTEKESAGLRSQAEEECAELRSQAESASLVVRR